MTIECDCITSYHVVHFHSPSLVEHDYHLHHQRHLYFKLDFSDLLQSL